VKVGVPEEERELMQLYPQPRGRTPSVEYVPGPQRDPTQQPTLPRRRAIPGTRSARG
jgi:hypothetical protein